MHVVIVPLIETDIDFVQGLVDILGRIHLTRLMNTGLYDLKWHFIWDAFL